MGGGVRNRWQTMDLVRQLYVKQLISTVDYEEAKELFDDKNNHMECWRKMQHIADKYTVIAKDTHLSLPSSFEWRQSETYARLINEVDGSAVDNGPGYKQWKNWPGRKPFVDAAGAARYVARGIRNKNFGRGGKRSTPKKKQ